MQLPLDCWRCWKTRFCEEEEKKKAFCDCAQLNSAIPFQGTSFVDHFLFPFTRCMFPEKMDFLFSFSFSWNRRWSLIALICEFLIWLRNSPEWWFWTCGCKWNWRCWMCSIDFICFVLRLIWISNYRVSHFLLCNEIALCLFLS